MIIKGKYDGIGVACRHYGNLLQALGSYSVLQHHTHVQSTNITHF
jgi:hypothetical protein